ncbi:cupin domain-containing protein [Pseudomonas mohnii]|jgi:mannose-6-phosphate isomerase-like protein (cupin superfamily)|uniref:cupin domain-containing protein n=1 Tax=Pseudomonas sp. MIL9 TaxID=2807620 RepID=UPI00102A96D1|nr:cupin domain-containing protein [Pseudomonas sp. MIL9]MBM6443994.1 cupin domain-containing protein [Pseudomonas sp. MIL9]RZO04482.1 cupin domain-containing protein [Pseudomonas moorei]
MRTVHVIDAGNVPAPVNVVGETITILAGGDLSKPFEVHIQEGVQGGGPPPHFHPWDEAFLVIDGQVEVTVEGKATTISAGGYVHIPGGSVHAYKNISPTARMIGVVSDPRGGQFFAAMDRFKVPDDLPRIFEIAKRYDVTFLLPKPDATSAG